MRNRHWIHLLTAGCGIGAACSTFAGERTFPLPRVQRTSAERPATDGPGVPPPPAARIRILGTAIESRIEEAPAQPAPTAHGAITLDELQALALRNNPTIQQGRAVVRRYVGQFQQAGLYPNPSGGYMASEIGNEGHAGQEGYYFEQEFVTANKLGLSQQIARQDYQRAQCALKAQQLRVENATRREFYSILVAERRFELSRQLVEIAEQSVRITEARLKREEGTKVDVLQAKIEVETARQSLISAENAVHAAWKRLESVVGTPLTNCTLVGDPLVGIPDLSWDDVWEKLRANSPQLNAAKWNVRRAQAQVNRARVEPIPNVIGQGIHQYDANSEYHIAGVQIGIAIPVFNRNQGNIRAAEADVVGAARDVQRLERALQRNMANAYRDYSTALAQAERYRNDIIPAARETLQASRALFEAGELSYLQLQTAQRTYTQTNLQYLEVVRELWDNVVAIDGMLLIDGLASPENLEPDTP